MSPAEMSNTAHTLTYAHSPLEIRRTLSINNSSYYYKSIPYVLSIHNSQQAILVPLVTKSFAYFLTTYGVVRLTHDIRRLSLLFNLGLGVFAILCNKMLCFLIPISVLDSIASNKSTNSVQNY